MTPDDLERLEQTAMAMVVQALTDYREQAVTIFREESDLPQDIAEDITREALELMGVSGWNERLYGKVDFKKAVYVFLPSPHPVALMLDSKAEKSNGDRTATIQMSQTSMRVRMRRSGVELDEPGRLEQVITRGGRSLHVVTIIAKYAYVQTDTEQELRRIIVSCIPNGLLQERYNPNSNVGIWRSGRDSPMRGEDFRVRLDYAMLAEKAPWRVQEIVLPQEHDDAT